MTAPTITGSFFHLQHVNLWDAAYWTGRCRLWKEENWRALVADMHGIGSDTLICTSCEVFSREWGPDGRPVCIPGPIERVVELLRLQAPVADKVVCYQYQGIMNRRTTLVDIGAEGTQELYEGYAAYLSTR